jgi:hypothetical protein
MQDEDRSDVNIAIATRDPDFSITHRLRRRVLHEYPARAQLERWCWTKIASVRSAIQIHGRFNQTTQGFDEPLVRRANWKGMIG